jgi:cytochrome c-type protein NapC
MVGTFAEASVMSLRAGLLAVIRRRPIIATVVLFLSGVIFWGGFNWSLELANTERFCISCHVMRDYVYQEYKITVHYRNRTGVRASCPDCHVPQEWIHKVVRKVQATKELFHWFQGTIDTPEKFAAKRLALAQKVWSSMEATDSRECRNCHEIGSMNAGAQATVAGRMHQLALKWEMTCINCHKGIAHHLPQGFNRDADIDAIHDRLEKEKVKCRTCHRRRAGARNDDD